GGPMIASGLTVNNVIVEAHRLSQPVRLAENGKHVAVTLPDRVAKMYLDMAGEWGLPPLSGISTAPLLAGAGDIRHTVGYDPSSRLWCSGCPLCAFPTAQTARMPQRRSGCCATPSKPSPSPTRCVGTIPASTSMLLTSIIPRAGTRPPC